MSATTSSLLVIRMALVSIAIFPQHCFSQEEAAPLPQVSEAELLVTEAESPLPELLPLGLTLGGSMRKLPGLPRWMPGFGGSTPDASQCWSSIMTIPGCVRDILGILLGAKVPTLDASCCKAVTQITDSCFEKIFPVDSSYHRMIQKMCSH